MSLKKLACLSFVLLFLTSGSLSFNYGSEIKPASSSLLTGVWDFQVNIDRVVGRDGFIKKEPKTKEWVVRLKQDGEGLTGEIIGARGGLRGRPNCGDAGISGSVKEEKVNFVITWRCSYCSEEQTNFVGEVRDNGKTLVGHIEPADIPKTDCNLSYGEIKATRR